MKKTNFFRRIFLHLKRIWLVFGVGLFILILNPLIGLICLVVMISISLLFFRDPFDYDEKAFCENFSEEEMDILDSKTIDENITDDEFLELKARALNFICPQRIDRLTQLKGVKLTNDSFMFEYDIDENRIHSKNWIEELKQEIRLSKETSKKEVFIQRIIRSNRNLIYRYWYSRKDGYAEIVLTPAELMER